MRRCARSVKIQTQPRKPVLNHADFTASTGQHELDHTHHTDHTDQDYVRCLRCTKFCSLGKRINIVMKPTNSPTQGQPNPRKIRLKVALGLLFPTVFFFVGWDWFYIGNRLQETQPTRESCAGSRQILRLPSGNMSYTHIIQIRTSYGVCDVPSSVGLENVYIPWYIFMKPNSPTQGQPNPRKLG